MFGGEEKGHVSQSNMLSEDELSMKAPWNNKDKRGSQWTAV